MTPETIGRLKAQLLTSNLSQQNQALFQIINTLIDGIGAALFSIQELTGGTSSGGSGGLAGQSFVTVNNDVATLPNSSQIIAGNGIVFNRVANRLIISVAIPIAIDGQDGEQGPIGPPGIQGIPGPVGVMGPPGFDGECSVEYFPMTGTTLI